MKVCRHRVLIGAGAMATTTPFGRRRDIDGVVAHADAAMMRNSGMDSNTTPGVGFRTG